MLIYIPIRKIGSEILFPYVLIRESNLFFARDLTIKCFLPSLVRNK
jgi:hypothetical protein